jgi:hypothetical protein
VKKAQDLDLSSLAAKTDLNDFRAATKTGLAKLRTDLTESRASMKTDLAKLRAELIKWVVGIGFAQVAMILAVLRLFPGVHP